MRLGDNFECISVLEEEGFWDMVTIKRGRPSGTHGEKVLEDVHLMSRDTFLTLIMENAFQLISLSELQGCLVELLAGWGVGIQDS